DSGAAGVPSRTTTIDGINMMNFREVTAGGESDMVAPDPKDPEVIYGGRVEKLDLRTQQTQTIDPTLVHRDVDRATWTLPLAFSRRDPRVLYFARERLFRTEDGGQRWTAISPDLSREDPGVPATLDPATAADKPRAGRRHGVIYAIAPSRLADRDIWAGTDDGKVWRTRDEGAHWADLTPAGLAPWSKVGIIDTSHFDPETAYIAVDRHRLDDFRPYVYRTHDGGKTWTAVANGIPEGQAVNVVRGDPVRRGLLYAGTERGVYVSFDDGGHWQSLQMNLPVTSVRDIDVHGNDVVIGTHGRAFWVLDDVTPLRQMDARPPAPAYLFAPAATARVRPAGFTGTPLPKDEPMAANPPAGASIDYVLSGPAAGPVVIRIVDAQERTVREYSSEDRLPATDLTTIRVAPEWILPPSPPARTPGMHRFVWPIRYPAPAALADGNPYADGLWAPPGRYTVELSVGQSQRTQPLTILPDPRVTMTPEAYARQFALARRIEAAAARVAEAVTALDAVHKRLAGGGAAGLDLRVQALLGPDFGGAPIAPPPGLTPLRTLAGKLRRFLDAVDDADAPPSPDVEAGFTQIEPVVEASLAAFKRLLTQVLSTPPP
ncbi:MAG TPA: hypothetical protein VGQ33_19295, partial [Vicinamibacteria bacterium]|nr:hypothetical protein [Vicinamibacteria bacterium]